MKVKDGISTVGLWQCGDEVIVGRFRALVLHYDGLFVVRKLVNDVGIGLLQFEVIEGTNTVGPKANTKVVGELVR